ncbi:MAG: GIY-YIG nuclease family protein [Clostridia bacterium]|nr:GIY-YIG nuclease family protein [Clostridia bacterium]
MQYFVYIITNNHNTVLYIGVTNDIVRRVYEHKNGFVDGFTKRYNLCKLVYYEEYNDVNDALAREKQLKGWKREKKNLLVERLNPNWQDFSTEIC